MNDWYDLVSCDHFEMLSFQQLSPLVLDIELSNEVVEDVEEGLTFNVMPILTISNSKTNCTNCNGDGGGGGGERDLTNFEFLINPCSLVLIDFYLDFWMCRVTKC